MLDEAAAEVAADDSAEKVEEESAGESAEESLAEPAELPLEAAEDETAYRGCFKEGSSRGFKTSG
jgi:hypothetical protein